MNKQEIQQHSALWQNIDKLPQSDKDFIRSLATNMELTPNQAKRLDKLAQEWMKGTKNEPI